MCKPAGGKFWGGFGLERAFVGVEPAKQFSRRFRSGAPLRGLWGVEADAIRPARSKAWAAHRFVLDSPVSFVLT